MQNIFEFDVDLKKQNYIEEPVITQNDKARFAINVFDNDVPVNLNGITTITLANLRPDNKSVVINGSRGTGTNQILFEIGRPEVSIVGRVQATVQFYDSSSRVSTMHFTYQAVKDPANINPTGEDKTLIELVLGEGPAIIAAAQQATEKANTAASNASQAATDAQTAADNIVDAIANANTAANNANDMANLAQTVAGDATTATDNANTATANANQATADAEQATQAINLILPNVEGWHYVEHPYDSTATYAKNNIVNHNGSSFISLVDNNIGNTPITVVNPYWGLIALRGVDGLGSVVSVNGIPPDENGNVVLDIPNPENYATKSELNTLGTDLTNHVNDGSAHGIGTTPLETTDKTIRGAINELLTDLKELGSGESWVTEVENFPDLNAVTDTGLYIVNNAGGTLNTPPDAGSSLSYSLQVLKLTETRILQFFTIGSDIYVRNRVTETVWSAWSRQNQQREIGTMANLRTTNKNNLVAAINETFQFANDGKTAIASAVDAKGVPASPTDTFPVLADKIGQISGASRHIKSIQRVNSNWTEITSTLSIPVNEVNPDKSVLVVEMVITTAIPQTSAGNIGSLAFRGDIASTGKSITLVRGATGQNTMQVNWTLIEFDESVTVQKGTGNMGNDTSIPVVGAKNASTLLFQSSSTANSTFNRAVGTDSRYLSRSGDSSLRFKCFSNLIYTVNWYAVTLPEQEGV